MSDRNRLMKFHSSILQVASIIKNNEQKKSEDSFEMEKKKRERKANYSREETDRLVALIIPRKHILENKMNGAYQWQEKKQAWEDIEREFNHRSDGYNYRDSKTLRIKYESLKRDIKRKWSIIVGQRRDAHGKLPKLSPAEKKIKDIMELPIEEGFCDFSSMNEKSDYDDGDSSDSNPLNIYSRESERLSVKQETKHSDEEDTKYLETKDDASEFQSLSDGEPPNKKMYENNSAKKQNIERKKTVTIEFQPLSESLSKESHEDPLTSMQSVQNACADQIDKSIKEEKLQAARLQTELLRHEIELKKLQRKIMEEDLTHKNSIYELEKQHLMLKIESFKNGK